MTTPDRHIELILLKSGWKELSGWKEKPCSLGMRSRKRTEEFANENFCAQLEPRPYLSAAGGSSDHRPWFDSTFPCQSLWKDKRMLRMSSISSGKTSNSKSFCHAQIKRQPWWQTRRIRGWAWLLEAWQIISKPCPFPLWFRDSKPCLRRPS